MCTNFTTGMSALIFTLFLVAMYIYRVLLYMFRRFVNYYGVLVTISIIGNNKITSYVQIENVRISG